MNLLAPTNLLVAKKNWFDITNDLEVQRPFQLTCYSAQHSTDDIGLNAKFNNPKQYLNDLQAYYLAKQIEREPAYVDMVCFLVRPNKQVQYY